MRKTLSYILLWMLGCLNASAASYTFDVNKGITFSWQYDDLLGVYTTKGTRIKHWALADGQVTSFSSYGWSLVENCKYYLYYPYNNSYYVNDIPITNSKGGVFFTGRSIIRYPTIPINAKTRIVSICSVETGVCTSKGKTGSYQSVIEIS